MFFAGGRNSRAAISSSTASGFIPWIVSDRVLADLDILPLPRLVATGTHSFGPRKCGARSRGRVRGASSAAPRRAPRQPACADRPADAWRPLDPWGGGRRVGARRPQTASLIWIGRAAGARRPTYTAQPVASAAGPVPAGASAASMKKPQRTVWGWRTLLGGWGARAGPASRSRPARGMAIASFSLLGWPRLGLLTRDVALSRLLPHDRPPRSTPPNFRLNRPLPPLADSETDCSVIPKHGNIIDLTYIYIFSPINKR
jgi:hypothetical protein